MRKLLTLCLMAVLPAGAILAADMVPSPEQAPVSPPESIAAGIASAIRAETAEQAVEQATDEIIRFIDTGKAYAEEEPERFYGEVEALLRPMIDFPRFARNVMGVYYRTADDAQRERFAESFKWSLVRTYALALTQFGGGEIEVLAPRRPPRDPDKVSVNMQITQEGRDYGVVYMMQRGDDAVWQLRNLVIEGVNVGLNFKSQFAAAMKDPANNRDLDTVIEAWAGIINEDSEAPGDDDTAEVDPEQEGA